MADEQHAELMNFINQSATEIKSGSAADAAKDLSPADIKRFAGEIQGSDEMERFREKYAGKLQNEDQVREAVRSWQMYLTSLRAHT